VVLKKRYHWWHKAALEMPRGTLIKACSVDVAFFQLPHAVQALDGDFGVLLPWATVLPALDPKSPAAAVWAPP